MTLYKKNICVFLYFLLISQLTCATSEFEMEEIARAQPLLPIATPGRIDLLVDEDVEQAFQAIFLKQRQSSKTKVLLGSGVVLGVVSSVFLFNLSQDFWSQNGVSNRVAMALLSLENTLPLFALTASVTAMQFSEMYHSFTTPKNVSKLTPTCFSLERSRELLFNIVYLYCGASMATARTYLTHQYYNDIGKAVLFLDLSAFFTAFIRGYWSVDNLFTPSYYALRRSASKYFHRNLYEVEKKRYRILQGLQNAKTNISAMDKNVFEIFLNGFDDNSSYTGKVRYILSQESLEEKAKYRLSQALGLTVGVISAFNSKQLLSIAGSYLFENVLGFDTETAVFLGEIGSCFGVATLALSKCNS